MYSCLSVEHLPLSTSLSSSPKESLHFPPLFSVSTSHLLLLDTSQGSQIICLMVILNRYDYEGKRSDFALHLNCGFNNDNIANRHLVALLA